MHVYGATKKTDISFIFDISPRKDIKNKRQTGRKREREKERETRINPFPFKNKTKTSYFYTFISSLEYIKAWKLMLNITLNKLN